MYLIKNIEFKITFFFYLNMFYILYTNVMYSCDGKAELSTANNPVFSDFSEMMLCIIILCRNSDAFFMILW